MIASVINIDIDNYSLVIKQFFHNGFFLLNFLIKTGYNVTIKEVTYLTGYITDINKLYKYRLIIV